MPRKKDIDLEALLGAVKAGKTSKQIMDELGIKTSVQLKTYYADALMSTGQIPEIKLSRGRPKSTTPKAIQVNEKGALIIPRELVIEMGFKEGDTFNVRKSKSGLSLKRS
jgi:hypothetical protein